MIRDILRILLRLGILAGSALLVVAVDRFAPGSDWVGLIVLAPTLAVVFLIMGIFAAGAKAPVVEDGGDSVHRLSWGAILFFGMASAATAAFILFVLQHAEPFWFWSLSVPSIAICVYFCAGAYLYRVRCDERRLCIRGWSFWWVCHEWDDLVSIYQDEDQLRLLFSKTDYAEMAGYMTGIDRIHAIARAALGRNNLDKGDDDA